VFNFGPNTVEFSVLVDKSKNWDETVERLKQEGVEIVRNNAKVSDYLDCVADRKIFCRLFKAKLRYKTMKVGSFELKAPGEIPKDLPIKLVLLKRNIMLPSKFIKLSNIKKKP